MNVKRMRRRLMTPCQVCHPDIRRTVIVSRREDFAILYDRIDDTPVTVVSEAAFDEAAEDVLTWKMLPAGARAQVWAMKDPA